VEMAHRIPGWSSHRVEYPVGRLRQDAVTIDEARDMHQEMTRAEDRRHELESKALILQSARIEEALLEIKDELKFIRSRVR